MKQVVIIVAMLLLAVSCESMVRDTMNIGSGQGQRLSVTLNAPTGTGPNAPGLFGGESVLFSATVIGVNGPFDLHWHFGGAAAETTTVLATAGTNNVSVTLVDIAAETDFTATISVTDSTGLTQSDSVTFSIGAAQNMSPWEDDWSMPDETEPRENRSPNITELFSEQGNIIISAVDPDGDSLQFSAELLNGDVELIGPFRQDGSSAEFHLFPLAELDLLTFNIRFTVRDNFGGREELQHMDQINQFQIRPDQLYAIPEKNRTDAGDSVRITVVTGSTAHPFQYMNGCGVTCDPGVEYRPGSFDTGAPDSTPDFGIVDVVDGVWADMGVSEFLLAPDQFITESDNGDGLLRTDFNVTPLGGRDITAEGELFSFEYVFNEPGIYRISFQEVKYVARTYYQDSTAATDFFWSDIDNNHQYNTIVVE